MQGAVDLIQRSDNVPVNAVITIAGSGFGLASWFGQRRERRFLIACAGEDFHEQVDSLGDTHVEHHTQEIARIRVVTLGNTGQPADQREGAHHQGLPDGMQGVQVKPAFVTFLGRRGIIKPRKKPVELAKVDRQEVGDPVDRDGAWAIQTLGSNTLA